MNQWDKIRSLGSEVIHQIKRNFAYHPPKDGQAEKYEDLRANAKNLALLMAAYCPPSRELSVAMIRLEEAVMWANASIARNE